MAAYAWRLGKRLNELPRVTADIGPLPARFPASVQQLLLEAGWYRTGTKEEIPWPVSGWNIATGILAHGSPRTCSVPGKPWYWTLPDWIIRGGFSWIVPKRPALKAHCFPTASTSAPPWLTGIPTCSPSSSRNLRENRGSAATPHSHYFKPRYNYGWDWCPRIVPIGPQEPAALLTGPDSGCTHLGVTTRLEEDLRTGMVDVVLTCGPETDIHSLYLSLCDGGNEIAAVTAAMSECGECRLTLSCCTIEPRFPNGAGPQKVYTARITGQNKVGEPSGRFPEDRIQAGGVAACRVPPRAEPGCA